MELNDDSFCDDPMIIGIEKKCNNCGKKIIIYATHEVALCAECSMLKCPIKRRQDETD